MKRRMTKDGTVRQSGTNRRDFLKYSALVAGYGVYVATEKRNVAFAQQSANEKVNVAWCGVGGKGDSDSSQVSNHANLLAICDIDSNMTDKKLQELSKKGKPAPKVYNDWRKMYDEMGKQLDGVGISTPDHNHAIITMHAIKMGKGVYTQKPLAHTVAEARALRLAAREHKVATQMGNQGTATNGLRSGVEVLRAGAIGTIKEVHIWTNRPIWPQAPEIMDWPQTGPAPKHVNWDVWLGPAPERGFSTAFHTFKWRGYWDFGTGALGDMGCHTANLPFMALELGSPTSIKGVCGDLNNVTYPSWATVEYEFPARGNWPPVKVYWYEGHFDRAKKLKNLPPLHLFHGERINDSGSLVVGDKGIFYSPNDYGGTWMLLPREQYKDFKNPPQTLPRHNGGNDDENMKIEWVGAIKGGPKGLSNFDYAGMLAEFILLGNVANKVPGQPLLFDGENLKFTNNDKANQYLRTEYREGWSL